METKETTIKCFRCEREINLSEARFCGGCFAALCAKCFGDGVECRLCREARAIWEIGNRYLEKDIMRGDLVNSLTGLAV